MIIPVQIFIYLIIIVIYFIHKKRKGQNYNITLKFLGFSFSSIKFYGLGLLISFFSIMLALCVIKFVSIDITQFKEVIFKSNIVVDKVSFNLILGIFFKELIFVAFGEELFFRGLIGGLLFKKYSFLTANLLQTIIFVLPHTLLLCISISFFPFILIQFFSGWLLGWLRNESHSILPCIISHSIVNTLVFLFFL